MADNYGRAPSAADIVKFYRARQIDNAMAEAEMVVARDMVAGDLLDPLGLEDE